MMMKQLRVTKGLSIIDERKESGECLPLRAPPFNPTVTVSRYASPQHNSGSFQTLNDRAECITDKYDCQAGWPTPARGTGFLVPTRSLKDLKTESAHHGFIPSLTHKKNDNSRNHLQAKQTTLITIEPIDL